MRKFVFAGAIAALAMISTSAPAYGKGCSGNVKDPPSAVQQYVEQQPTACGSTATGTSNKTRKIPKSIQRKIDQDGGNDAALLKKVVSNESYGAPQVKIKTHAKKAKAHSKSSKATPGSKVILSDSEKRSSGALSASMGAFTDGSDSRLIGLIVLMVAIAAIVVASAFRRRRLPR